MILRFTWSLPLVSSFLLLTGCGSSLGSGDSDGSGGAPGGGAGNSGGSSAGGVSSGGSTTAGGSASTGGAVSGGAPAAGGQSAGGAHSTGGSASGGEGTGGSVSGGSGSGGAAQVEPCPADATFCSGFDESALPTGAVFKLNGDPSTPWTEYFEVDATTKHSGASALRVKPVSEVSAAYKMLSVPSGGAEFWVRLYMRSDKDLGDPEHNVFGQASGSDEPNDSASVEFAEDVGISFNSQDVVRWPAGYGRLMSGGTMPYSLPKDTWHCVELHFDGDSRVQEAYLEGELLIEAADYPAATMAFTRFKFGYNALHFTERTVWYDDIAVGPTRPHCLE